MEKPRWKAWGRAAGIRASQDCLTARGQRHVRHWTQTVKSNNFLMFGKIKTKRPLNTVFEVHFTHRDRDPEHSVLGASQLGVRKRTLHPGSGFPSRDFHRGCTDNAKKVAWPSTQPSISLPSWLSAESDFFLFCFGFPFLCPFAVLWKKKNYPLLFLLPLLPSPLLLLFLLYFWHRGLLYIARLALS